MIDRVALSRSGLVTSRLGFGTSRLHYSDSKTRALLLETAVDLGLTHIDTAPAYGDTLAEREIGNVLRGKRDRLVIATKYGIPPNSLVSAVPFLAFPLRAGRTVLRKVVSRDVARPLMTPYGLRVSLERSLRHLRTDWVDILLLHEPTLATIAGPEPTHSFQLKTRISSHALRNGLRSSDVTSRG